MIAKLFTLTLLAASLASPASTVLAAESAPAPQRVAAFATPDPAARIQDWARLFRNDDVAGLAQALVPPSRWEEVRLVHELVQLEPISDSDHARFVEEIERFTAVDAVDVFMEQIEPKLDEARAQWPGARLMAFTAIHIAINSSDSELTDEQRAALQSVLPGIQQWANSTDFMDPGTMRQALTLLVDSARGIGLTDIDELKALPFDALLDRASPMLAAAKRAVGLYGIDLDSVADSVRAEVLEINGDTARVRTTITLFDAPVWGDHELVLVEGHWYGAAVAREWRTRHVARAGD